MDVHRIASIAQLYSSSDHTHTTIQLLCSHTLNRTAPLITHTHIATLQQSISLAVNNMFLLGFSLCLGIVHGIVPEISKTDMDIIANMETNVVQEQSTLSDMFNEVEDLMEDTQQKLEDAVHQVYYNLFISVDLDNHLNFCHN